MRISDYVDKTLTDGDWTEMMAVQFDEFSPNLWTVTLELLAGQTGSVDILVRRRHNESDGISGYNEIARHFGLPATDDSAVTDSTKEPFSFERDKIRAIEYQFLVRRSPGSSGDKDVAAYLYAQGQGVNRAS